MVTFTAMSFITMVLGYNTNLVKRSDVPHRPTRDPWQSIFRVISAAIITAGGFLAWFNRCYTVSRVGGALTLPAASQQLQSGGVDGSKID